MATNFPTSLDSLTNPTASDPLNNPSHADQHANVNDAVEALEAKVGVNSSAVTTSHDYKITRLENSRTVSDSPPSSPVAGDLWYESDTGRMFVYYDSFWVEYGPNVNPADAAVLTSKGDLLTRSSSGLVRLGVGSNGDALLADSGATEGLRWQGQQIAGKNKIINGNMQIAQRGTSFVAGANNDDTYNLDRWYVLSDGNDAVDITQSTDAPTNGLNSIALDVETVNKKFGIAQIIEQKNCIGLIGETVTLSFMARVSSTTKLDNVKAAIIAWSGTADTVTSDVVSAWNVEGTNPTLSASLTYENSPANLNVTTSWARYTITAAVDTASTKNIIVFIWSDVTDTTLGDFLYITDVQLEYGSVATRFTMHAGGFESEVAACQRYFWRSTGGDAYQPFGTGAALSTTVAQIFIRNPVEMRTKAASVTGNTLGVTDTVSTFAVTDITISNANALGTAANATSSGLTQFRPYQLNTNNSSTGWLAVSAEL